MVIITDYKPGDLYFKGYHVEYLVKLVLSVIGSKHINAQMNDIHTAQYHVILISVSIINILFK